VIDGLFAANNMANEMWSYSTMLAEVKSTFEFVNLSTSSGNVTQTKKYVNSSFDFNLIPKAYAQSVGKGNSIPGISALSASDLAYGNVSIDKLYAGYPAFADWFEKNKQNFIKAGIDNNALVARLMKAADDYDRNLFAIAITDASLYSDPGNQQLLNARNLRVQQLSSGLAVLISDGSKTIEVIDRLPKGNALGELESAEKKTIAGFALNEILIYGGAGLGGMLILIIVIVLIRRKRKTGSKVFQQPVKPEAFTQAPQTSNVSGNQNAASVKPDTANPTIQSSSPKFCPKCGTPLKQGAKFCGKCGYKT
jgi:hypothetical protein